MNNKNKWFKYFIFSFLFSIIIFIFNKRLYEDEGIFTFRNFILIIVTSTIITILLTLQSKKDKVRNQKIDKRIYDFNNNKLIGKSLTVTIIFRDYYHRKIEEYITSGKILSISESGILQLERIDEPTIKIPFPSVNFVFQKDKDISKKARNNNTDYYIKLTLNNVNKEFIANYKEYGYTAK